jgi:hypothetical protein
VRGTTRFTFQVRGLELEDPGDLELAVYTVKGRRVAHRRLELQSAGGQLFSEDWRPVNDLGDPLGRGVYLYRLKLPLPAISYSLIDDLGQAQTRRIGAQTLEGTGKMIVE